MSSSERVGRWQPLKQATQQVVTALAEYGCVGMVVTLPSDNKFSYTEGDEDVRVRRYVAARHPQSLVDTIADQFCIDNECMKSAAEFHTKPFDPARIGLDAACGHGVKMVMATSLPLAGITHVCTAYWLFRAFPEQEVVAEITKNVQTLSYSIWRSLRASLESDKGGITSTQVMALKFAARGDGYTEMAQALGASPKNVEKNLSKARARLGATSTLDAVVRAQMMLII